MLQAVRERRVVPVASWDLASEIARVLRSPKLRRYRVREDDVREMLALLAPFLPKVEIKVPVRDPRDVAVVTAALDGGAAAIVTGDHDLLEDEALRRRLEGRGIRLLTPRELLQALG